MGTPVRQSIIDNMYTVLSGISTSGGYKTNVTTVEILGKVWAQVPQGLRPWVGIFPRSTKYQYLPANRVRAVFRISLIAHVSAGTMAAKREALNDLEDDIFEALNADTTRNLNAISTTIVETETDEGDPESEGSMVIDVDVAYMRTTGST